MAEPVNQVRALIADTDQSNQILDDATITVYLSLHPSTPAGVRRAAADALDAIATSEALIGKYMRTQDVTVDGAKVADALRKQAEAQRREAQRLDDDAADEDATIGVLEFEPYPRSWR